MTVVIVISVWLISAVIFYFSMRRMDRKSQEWTCGHRAMAIMLGIILGPISLLLACIVYSITDNAPAKW